MQGTLQRIGHRLRKGLRAIGEKTDQGSQMCLRLVAEYFQQLRIKLVGDRQFKSRRGRSGWLGRHDGRRRLTSGQRMRGGSQTVDIVALALGLAGELFDKLGHQRHHISHYMPYRFVGLDTAVEDPIE